jgi:hypothetical protein
MIEISGLFFFVLTFPKGKQVKRSLVILFTLVIFTAPAVEIAGRGMRHTSMALYFYGASKKSLHKPRAIYENMLFHLSYGLIIIYNFYI